MSPRIRAFALVSIWVLALIALGFYAHRSLKVSTDLRSFMPPAQTADQKLLMNQIGEGPASRLMLLSISGVPAPRLAELSRGLTSALRKDSRFTQILNGAVDISTLDSSLLPYRFLLSPTLDREHYDATFLRTQLQERVQDLGSPASSLLEPLLPRDPTLEVLKLAEQWTPPKSPALNNGVWFSEQNEALLLVQTRAAGFDPTKQGEALDALKSAFHTLPGVQGARLLVTGPGYFSVVVSTRTHAEAD